MPEDWFESNEMVDPTIPGEAQDIVRLVISVFGEREQFIPHGPMTKADFMKQYGMCTHQL